MDSERSVYWGLEPETPHFPLPTFELMALAVVLNASESVHGEPKFFWYANGANGERIQWPLTPLTRRGHRDLDRVTSGPPWTSERFEYGLNGVN